MTKNEFLEQLKNNIQQLDSNQINEIMTDFKEHFESGIEQGKTEEEICGALGDPKEIAQQFGGNNVSLEQKKEVNVFAVIGLSIFNIFFMVWIFFTLFMVLFSLWISAISIAFSGIAVSLASALYPILQNYVNLFIHPVLAFLVGLIICVMGLLFVNLNIWLTKISVNAFRKYVNWNISVVKG